MTVLSCTWYLTYVGTFLLIYSKRVPSLFAETTKHWYQLSVVNRSGLKLKRHSFDILSVSAFLYYIACLAHLYKLLKGTKGTFTNLIFGELAWRTSCVCKPNVYNPSIPPFGFSAEPQLCVLSCNQKTADSRAIDKLGLGKAKGVQYIAAEHCFPDRKLYTSFCQNVVLDVCSNPRWPSVESRHLMYSLQQASRHLVGKIAPGKLHSA